MTEDAHFRPPVLVGERVAWLGSGSGMPQSATVRWIGRIPEITQGWTVGIELDHPMPVGGIDGTWRKRQLFSCEPKRGLLVPVDKIMKESSLLNTRHSLGEAFYDVSKKRYAQRNQDLIRQLSLPQSASTKEFLAKVLPQSEKHHSPQRKDVSNSDVALNFKKAANSIQNQGSTVEVTNDLNKTSPASLAPAPLTVENVKAFDVEVRVRNEHRKKTLEELEKFKKHLDDLEKLKSQSHRLKKKKIGENPESLYSQARTVTDTGEALFLRVVGEKTEKTKTEALKDPVAEGFRKIRSPHEKRKVLVKSVILEEQYDVQSESLIVEKSLSNEDDKKDSPNLVEIRSLSSVQPREEKQKNLQVKVELLVHSAAEETFVGLEEFTEILKLAAPIGDTVLEKTEPENCSETVTVCENAAKECFLGDDSESVSGPTPTLRKKRQQAPPPVAAPRRRSSGCDGSRLCETSADDTTSVLYEPAFLREYLESQQQTAMTDVRGTFRRIDEDEIEPSPPSPVISAPPPRRLLATSVSVPASPRKGIFSFLKWFKKEKAKNDLDLEDFNAPSVAGSPLFTRSRLANTGSVDTLYSIATVSSFAFVSGAQYNNVFGSDKRKKRRAPPPPPQKRDISDRSLPNSLENRKKQQHRRSVSESYKDRRSGAFAHVNGKRKAPAPPTPPSNDRLYPSLSLLTDGSLTPKKRPAPIPPPADNASLSTAAAGEESVDQVADVTATRLDLGIPAEPEIPPIPEGDFPENQTSSSLKDDDIVCNDTLRLERGVLKPNKALSSPSSTPVPSKFTPSSPVSPRPWYKRKSLEKRKENTLIDWMPETGIPRPLASPEPNPLRNFFSRSDEKKKEDKRKSGLSILANISELDREAAEICRKEQANQQRLLADGDAKYYTESPPPSEPDVPKRSSTRELITLFNSIGSASNARDKDKLPVAVAVCDQVDIKTASVVGTKKCLEPKSPILSRAQALFDHRGDRQRSTSPTISTIAEISEPSSSAATLNQNAERIWICTRCTLENLNWKNRCDACSACKPNYSARKMERRKSEMELEIDWEKELEKYFPSKYSAVGNVIESEERSVLKDEEAETKQEKDVKEKETTDPKEGDLDEIRKKRIAFFMKALGTKNPETSLRDAASKKSLDESEKLKLKEMLKEMKNSLPKYEAAKNRGRVVNGAKPERLPDVTINDAHNSAAPSNVVDSNKSAEDAVKYGAIPKIRRDEPKRSEALLVTTTTVFEDIIVKNKKPQKKDPLAAAAGKTSKDGSSMKQEGQPSSRGSYELMRARDLTNIIESKTTSAYPSHIYANYPRSKVSDESSSEIEHSGREVARLATQLTRASGVAEFRASLDEAGANTVAVNRLLRQLEAAIAAGRHDQAATLARELADLKVNCSVVRQKPSSASPSPVTFTVELYVEDKVSHQGPIPLRVQGSMTVSDLKIKVQTELQIPCHVQRWILGKQLATEDFRTLEELGVTIENCPVFLYLVAPEPEPENTPSAPEEDVNAAAATSGSSRKVHQPPAPMGKGWYFNYEEDRYSFCESDSDNQSPERERVQIVEDADVKTEDELPYITETVPKIDEVRKQPVSQKTAKQMRRPLKTSASLPDDVGDRSSDRSRDAKRLPSSSISPEKKVEPYRPRSRSIFDLIKPQSNDTLKKDLKVISVNAVKETIEKLTRRSESTAGWRCELCTLVNEPARVVCAACTSPRPPGYLPPTVSPAEDELRRLRRNQAVDLPFFEEAAVSDNAHYLELVGLDSAGFVQNQEEFECPVCFIPQREGEGVVLRECLHNFCRTCLAMTIEHNDEAEVKCPYRDDNYSCESVLQEREIKALVPAAIFEQHLARGVAQAENRMGNAFHCKTPDCSGWCVLDDNVNQFACPVCSQVNCLTCSAIHQGIDCRTYQDRLKSSSDTNADSRRTRTMLEDMVQKGDAMACPTCQVVLMKKWGCDWLRCSMCKTEICWVTRGPRWGPNGKGDTSAGCQCGVNGVKCHPKCNYCH